jgi:hypothetical protein
MYHVEVMPARKKQGIPSIISGVAPFAEQTHLRSDPRNLGFSKEIV